MSNYTKWSEMRAEVVKEFGEEALADARKVNQAYIDAYRLAQRRKELGMTQLEVAQEMGVTKGRVSQIERGEVSTLAVIARYVAALGGTIQVSAVFDGNIYPLKATRPA
ncbi:helix-turn-helix transcriptional regulator [Myceligenerans crystallogenes]|uniref:XRE family transcriptional regulator n=1 Tax=Myceligenerans crystallogenes TaxID=316335 RepID=A0ABN2NG43_9MICO